MATLSVALGDKNLQLNTATGGLTHVTTHGKQPHLVTSITRASCPLPLGSDATMRLLFDPNFVVVNSGGKSALYNTASDSWVSLVVQQ